MLTREHILILLCLLFPLQAMAQGESLGHRLGKVSGVTDADCTAAESKKALGLFDLFALAVKHAETLKIEEETVKQAEASKLGAIGSYLPHLSLKGTISLPHDSDAKNAVSSMKNGLFLYAKQPLLTGLEEWSGIAGSKHSVLRSTYLLHQAASTLLYDVAVGYFSVKLLEKTLASRKAMLALYGKNLAELKHRVALGKSRQSELLKMSSQVYRLEAGIKSLDQQLASARLGLSAVIGVPLSGRELQEIGMLPGPPAKNDSIEVMIKERWDVKAAEEEVKLADTNLMGAIGGHLPSLYIEGAYRIYQADKYGADYYIGLGAELPIFSGFTAHAKIKEARSILRQSELRLSRIRRYAAKDIIDAYSNWEATTQELAAYQKAYKSAQEASKASLADYQLNLVTVIDVIASLSALETAREEYDRVQLQCSLDRILLGIALNEFPGEGIRILKSAGSVETIDKVDK